MIPEKLKRIEEFEKMGVGLFIHWGLYSQMEAGEWIQFFNKIPSDEYKKLIDTFHADGFKPREIAKMAKRNGMNYIVLTTRHHEGFSLYDTRGLSEFDIMFSPVKRDLIKEFVEACNEFDVVPFFYHTTLDWNVESFENNFDEYLEYLRKSVEVLCTNYGKVGGFWFDGNWIKPGDVWKEDELYATIRKHQPDAIIVNNTGLLAHGQTGNREIDCVTYEQAVPTAPNRDGMPKYLAGEMCQPTNKHWAVAKDLKYKSSELLIENLCSCRRVGANYLINIGLSADGAVLPMQLELLNAMGDWLKIYGEAIYDSTPSECWGQNKDFILNAHGHSYMFIFGLECFCDPNVSLTVVTSGAKVFVNVNKKIKSIKWIDNNEELEFMQGLSTNSLLVNATTFDYGINYVVRVAKIEYMDNSI